MCVGLSSCRMTECCPVVQEISAAVSESERNDGAAVISCEKTGEEEESFGKLSAREEGRQRLENFTRRREVARN